MPKQLPLPDGAFKHLEKAKKVRKYRDYTVNKGDHFWVQTTFSDDPRSFKLKRKPFKKDTIRVGDMVQILVPMRITRICYDNNMDDVLKEIDDWGSLADQVVGLCNKFVGKIDDFTMAPPSWLEQRLKRAVAAYICGKRIRDGAEKRVHYETVTDSSWFYVGGVEEVTKIEIKRVGTFHHTPAWQDYWSQDGDPEERRLGEAQTIKVLHIGDYKINADHVEKVYTETDVIHYRRGYAKHNNK